MKINDIRQEYLKLAADVEEILTSEDPLGLKEAGLDYEDEAEQIAEWLITGSGPTNEDDDHDLGTIEDCVFAVFASHYGREVEQGDEAWVNIAKKIVAIK